MTKKITSGTKEWADSNVNCYYGCSNNCRYCYAKKMAIRFQRKTENTWKDMIPNLKQINKKFRKRKGRIMFPTSHDITQESLTDCIKVLQNLLISENQVLITTKPKLMYIKVICKEFNKLKHLIQFRFTITSLDNEILQFWEPGAPPFEERFTSLKYSYNNDFKTSVSIEPFLDIDPIPLIEKIYPYVSESIWVGKMNYFRYESIRHNNKKYYEDIRKANSKENIKKVLREIDLLRIPLIKIKDSIYNYISN